MYWRTIVLTETYSFIRSEPFLFYVLKKDGLHGALDFHLLNDIFNQINVLKNDGLHWNLQITSQITIFNKDYVLKFHLLKTINRINILKSYVLHWDLQFH